RGGRDFLARGARVVRLEPPGGDPMRELAPGWYEALNAGKESVTCDLKTEPARGRALCAEADVVMEGFRPGVAERLGVGPGDLPETVVYCSITGFGLGGGGGRPRRGPPQPPGAGGPPPPPRPAPPAH